MPNWFDIDKQGLAKLMDGRPKSFIIGEMYQNCVDTNAKQVEMRLEKLPGTPKAKLYVIDDDPEGFKNFSHAWTMFAESTKKGDPTKRGLFNMGEKLVLALCYTANIKTTKGTVEFDDEGRHEHSRRKTEKGSVFEGIFRLNQEEYDECCAFARKLIPPTGVDVFFNGTKLQHRTPIASFQATLDTTKANEETGVVTKSPRKTEVIVYDPLPDEVPSIYEMGIPVVETGDKWHVDVQQRVPLNMNRDNVTPAYLKELRTLVVNFLHDELTEKDANATFVNEALSDPDATPEAVNKALDLKYTEKRAIWDPTDLEANMNLIEEGYTLIKGAQLTGDQWKNVKLHNAAPVAGQLRPTKKALFSSDGEDRWVKQENWSKAMLAVVDYTRVICTELTNSIVTVSVLSDITQYYGACYGNQGFVFNLGRLGHKFFDENLTISGEDGPDIFAPAVRLNQLIIHELGHHYEPNHLSEGYHEKLCELGAKLTRLALIKPELFSRSGR
jgi:hypothetical protein